MTIVTTHYRYKRPPKRRAKAAAIEGPVIVTISDKTRKRVRRSNDMTADPAVAQRPSAATPAEPPPVNDDRKSAIVTARRPRVRGGNRHLLAELPDTEEEHRERGDRADALFQEMKRQIAEKIAKDRT